MKTEEYILKKDIHTFCVTANSFPDGVLEAHQILHNLLPDVTDRNFFGISRPNDKGVIIYHAAVEENYENEGVSYNCKSLTLKKGKYISVLLKNYVNKPEDIGRAFHHLLQDPHIDPQGYCVEHYIGKNDVHCMVRLETN